MTYKPTIGLSRWAETLAGSLAANRVVPPSGERDVGHLANDVLPSGYYNELLGRHYEWLKYLDQLDMVSVKYYGAVGNGVANDTAAFQAALADAARQGKRLFVPRGIYLISSTLAISLRSTIIQGEFPDRNNVGGTQIVYIGTGPCFEIGTDDGQPWDASNYNGPQGHVFAGFRLSHTAQDTSLNLTGIGTGSMFKAGAYGIRDWRGGGIVLHQMGIEGFDYNFWGVQSDLNVFTDVKNLYSRFGIYAGPRSDQFTCYAVESFFCQRAFTLDRPTGVALVDCKVMFCGSNNTTTSPIEIRKGTSNVQVVRPWFENADGTATANMQGWIGAGLVDGYGPGGVGTTTTSAAGITVEDALFYTTNVGLNGHVRTLVALGAATGVRVIRPNPRPPSTFGALNAMIESPSGTSFTDSQSIAHVGGVTAALSAAALYLNSGSGNPAVSGAQDGAAIMQMANRHHFRRPSPTLNGSDEFFIGTEGSIRRFVLHYPNFSTGSGQRNLLDLTRVIMHGSAIPTSGTWTEGDLIINTLPPGLTGGDPWAWTCVAGGTPGSWAPIHRHGFSTGNTNITSSYLVLGQDRYIQMVGSTASQTLSLPDLSAGTIANRPYDGQTLTVRNGSSQTWTVAASGVATLFGSTSIVAGGSCQWIFRFNAIAWDRVLG